MHLLVEVLIILALTLINGLFAAAEVAMLSVRRTRLQELADDGVLPARSALSLRGQPERLLATIQVGITVVGAAAAAFGGARIASRLGAAIEARGVDGDVARGAALAVVIALVSYLSIVLGELVPKSLALRSAERFALVSARPLSWFASLARPFVWFFTASSNLVLRVFRDETTFSETRLSPEELQQLLEEAATAGTLPARSGEIAARALDFGQLTVRAVMTPRPDIIALKREGLREELARALARTPHDRYPVVDEDLDQPAGYVVVRDVAQYLTDPSLPMDAALNPPSFVPGSMNAMDALGEMQRSGSQLLLVVDELGAVIGLVTLEDLVEELVGDILAEKERPVPPVEHAEDGTVRVRGRVGVHEVNRALDLELPEGPGWTTIGGLVTSTAGRIPKPGAVVEIRGIRVEVLDATHRRVLSVRVHPPRAPHP